MFDQAGDGNKGKKSSRRGAENAEGKEIFFANPFIMLFFV